MDIDAIRGSIKSTIRSHSRAFKQVGDSLSKLLELGAITGMAAHYRSLGCDVTAVNPRGGSSFVVKTSTRGHHWNFSKFIVTHKGKTFELHMNLMVKGAHDEGVYCVDIGVTQPGKVPTRKSETKWHCLENRHLISFAEVKKLNIYPMLLAQFIGIVHEIMPQFLRRKRKPNKPHLPPTLIVLGQFSGNSRAIVNEYNRREVCVLIAENYDMRLARARRDDRSAFIADRQ